MRPPSVGLRRRLRGQEDVHRRQEVSRSDEEDGGAEADHRLHEGEKKPRRECRGHAGQRDPTEGREQPSPEVRRGFLDAAIDPVEFAHAGLEPDGQEPRNHVEDEDGEGAGCLLVGSREWRPVGTAMYDTLTLREGRAKQGSRAKRGSDLSSADRRLRPEE